MRDSCVRRGCDRGRPPSGGIFVGTAGGAQQTIALVGAAAPTAGVGATFSDFLDPDIEINSPGQVGFRAVIAGSAATAGYFVGSPGSAPVARLIEGQSLPDGDTVLSINTSVNVVVGENFSLTDSGQLSMFFTGGSNLNRSYIADQNGALRPFVVIGQQPLDTSGAFVGIFQDVTTNTSGRFF